MLHDLIASAEGTEPILEWIGWAALGIELLAVLIIIVAIAASTVQYFYHVAKRQATLGHYRDYKNSLARSLLLGLEILVAADVVRTVALEATIQSVAVLGMLVLIRTFLSWALVVETDGHWPWKGKPGQPSELD
jgi:uncharacterized membrane protein